MIFPFDEEWRRVPSVPHLVVSSYGRVYIDSYYNRDTYPSYGYQRGYEKRLIFTCRRKTYKVARLVCEAFHGPCPPDKRDAMHRDENWRNNRADNLKWGTHQENMNAPGFLAYCKTRTGENSPFSRRKKT